MKSFKKKKFFNWSRNILINSNEEHPINAQSPYSASKISADHLALSYWNSFQLPVKIIRPFNFYGSGMRHKDKRIIPQFFYQRIIDLI